MTSDVMVGTVVGNRQLEHVPETGGAWLEGNSASRRAAMGKAPLS
ncbi:hypothetical protein [Nocardioides sp. AN3]